jgi:hypothetical protein
VKKKDQEFTMKKFGIRALALAALACALPATAHAFHPGVDPAEFQAIREEVFTEADANGDGVLSAAEFANFHELMRAKMNEVMFTNIDSDGSGGISLTELQAARPPRGGRPD